jgi:beta-glucanase (GH16 family)
VATSRQLHRGRAGSLGALALALLLALLVWASEGPGQDPDRASATTSAAARDACGAAIYKGSGARWKCSFADNFRREELDLERWWPLSTKTSGYSHNRDCFFNRKANVRLLDGRLRLTSRKAASAFTCESPYGDFRTRYSSGFVTTYQKFSQTYGRFEARIKMPSTRVTGVHSAFWMWPDAQKYGSNPRSGEIDVAEWFSKRPRTWQAAVHYLGEDDDANHLKVCRVSTPSRFHTYRVVWTPRKISIAIDGRTCLTNRRWTPDEGLVKPQPFDHPFYINLTQALGRFGNSFDPKTTPLPATMVIDYVKAWS